MSEAGVPEHSQPTSNSLQGTLNLQAFPYEEVVAADRQTTPSIPDYIFFRFAGLESSASIVLLLAAAVALVLANSAMASAYKALLRTPIHLSIGRVSTSWTVHECVNDLLMALFFLVIGLEVKRELIVGELASFRRALLPMLAALGGVLTPIAAYLILNQQKAAEIGWGVPIATDVAFSLAVLALFGRRIPVGLKVFLVTLAIVDDIAGVVCTRQSPAFCSHRRYPHRFPSRRSRRAWRL